MTQRRRKYTAEFKREAITVYENSDRTMAQVKRELGMSRVLPTAIASKLALN